MTNVLKIADLIRNKTDIFSIFFFKKYTEKIEIAVLL